MTTLDLDAIRQRQYAIGLAEARVLRAADPHVALELADDYPAAHQALLYAVMDSRADVPALLAEVERLRHDLDTVERSDDARLAIVTAWATDAADVIRDLLRLSAVPGDPPDEAIVRQRAEALLAKMPPRPVLATGNALTEVE